MTDVVDLRRERALRSEDSKDWTVVDALEYTLAEIHAGRIKPHKVSISYLEPVGNSGAASYGRIVAGLSYAEHIALLVKAQAAALGEWSSD